MDFSLTEEQVELQALTARIFDHHLTTARRDELEAGSEWYDRELWAELARANVLGVGVPEHLGGTGHSFLEVCVVLEQLGRFVAPVPVLPGLLAVTAVATFGRPEQHHRWVTPAVTGDALLTVALLEDGSDDPLHVNTTATAATDGWLVNGTKSCVPAIGMCDAVLVPARLPDGEVALFVIDPRSAGVDAHRQIAPNGEPLHQVELSDAAASSDDMIRGPALLDWLVARATVGVCAIEAGVMAQALALTAAYTTERQQFGRPLATFQAVQQRAADAYIDVLAVQWCMWHAAWRLAEGLPADEDVAVAKFWAAEAGHRVVSAAQHLHGGVGVDLSYPLHRYFLWSKQLEVTLGSATRQLLRIGEGTAYDEHEIGL